jgi:hypothetical protein
MTKRGAWPTAYAYARPGRIEGRWVLEVLGYEEPIELEEVSLGYMQVVGKEPNGARFVDSLEWVLARTGPDGVRVEMDPLGDEEDVEAVLAEVPSAVKIRPVGAVTGGKVRC